MTTGRHHTTFPDGILAQHAHLTKMVAALRQAHADAVEGDELASRTADLLEDVRLHFANEEAEMGRAGYPKTAEHRHQHATFMRRLEVLRAEYVHGESELITMFTESLENWLKTHERTADRDVLEFLGLSPPSDAITPGRPPRT